MEVNRISNNSQNSSNLIEIPEREYSFSRMLDLFKRKESINVKDADKKQTVIKVNKKQEVTDDKQTVIDINKNQKGKVVDDKPVIIKENKKQEAKDYNQVVINRDNKQEDNVVKQTNSPKTFNLAKNETNDPNRYKPADKLSDDQFLREMFGGLAQELEGFGPACREFIPIFKELSSSPEEKKPEPEEVNVLQEDSLPIINEQGNQPDKEAYMFTFRVIKNFWADKCKK
ncbi:hypothetical protein NBO_366g0008 [Nosema bombycis CQ1]|uniref:Uncharacterized protein n=1 Tax=Nosema bombycis (strain CQ1 / CVCC 102059) TaxID=578461 RepID=R0MF70_NOSB1|nr:hypothetical protein NBO_366g0008 [Nosema bombycis CQ1]|eukprot:EOB12785.1 hypothetical protein NBO_366g0008 [Nosema bombycis CQ1]